VTLTRGITMPRGTDNATCHTWHFYFLFFKNFKKKLKLKKKLKFFLKRNQKIHRLTRGTLTNGVSQSERDLIEAIFKSWDAIDTFLKAGINLTH